MVQPGLYLLTQCHAHHVPLQVPNVQLVQYGPDELVHHPPVVTGKNIQRIHGQRLIEQVRAP